MRAAYQAGEIPTEITLADRGTIPRCQDEAPDGNAGVMQALLDGLILEGRKDQLVFVEDPKDPHFPCQ
jgi:hypothetical protein